MRHWHIAGLKAFERIIGSDVRAVSQPTLMTTKLLDTRKNWTMWCTREIPGSNERVG